MLKSIFPKSLKKVRDFVRKTNDHELQQLWSIYSQSPIPTFILNKEGKFIEYNEAMFELTGYTHEEIPDVDAWMPRLYPDEEYRGKVIEISRKSRQREIDVKRDEFIITRKDGKKRYVEFSVYDILHEGKPTNLQVVQGVDITERKKTDNELRQKTAEQEVLLSSIHAFVYYKDTESRLITANRAFAEMVNTPIDQLAGKTAYDLFPKEEAEAFHKDDKKVMESGKPRMNIEEPFTDAKGETKWASTSKIPYFGKNGKVGGMVGITWDITERKKAEEALKESEEKYRSLIENIPDVTWTASSEGITTFISSNIEKVYGYTQKEVYEGGASSWLGRIHPDDIGKVEQAFELLFTENRMFDIEYKIQRKDGEWIWAHDRAFKTYEEDGVMYADGVFIDITGRKQAEEALRESKNRYKMLLSAITSYVYTVTVESGKSAKTSHDNRCMGVTGYTSEEYESDPYLWINMVHEKDRDLVRNQVAQVLSGKSIPPLKHRIIHKDGSFIWVRNTLVPQYDKRGQIIFYDGIIADITEKKLAEESLKKKTSDLSTILTNMNQGIAYLNENNIITYLNHQCSELFGLKYEDVLGKNIYDFPHPEIRKKIESLINEFRSGGKTLNFIESINDKFIDTTFHRIEDDDGNYQGILINAVDITERKSLENQFIQAQKMESIGRLAGGIAHDFNNILTVILGNAQLALMSLTQEDPIIEKIMEIKNSADRAVNLTRQLLAFSRRQIIEPQVIILNNIVLEMDKMFRHLIGEDIELVTNPAKDLWPVKIDPGQIEQVLTNLVVNARDAMPKGGKLTIETTNVTIDEGYTQTHAGTKPGDYVMIAVSDTGVGMDEETVLHIFEPFFTTKEHGKGTGLGLSTCYGIVKQNGGNIWVYSEQRHGTSFKIYLPREFGETTSSFKRRNNSPKGTETILVVEDEPKVRQVTSSILRGKGYTIYEAANGEEALRVAEKDILWNIHLMITDVIMPRMSGKELSEHFKIKNPDIKVLFVSGYTDNSIVHHGVLEPGIAFLPKPFSPTALIRKVREILDE